MPRKRLRIEYEDNYDYAADDRVMTKKAGIIVASLLANLFLFFNVAFHTMLPSTMVIWSFPSAIVISYIILKIKKNI